MIDVGQPAPDFTAAINGDGTLTLSDLRGKNVVLYFYPKDDTPGCTKQATGFTELLPDFDKCNTTIIGVSRDPVKKHDKFIAKRDLKITLVADEDLTVNELYGVWVEKSLYGRKYMGTERTTFLIDGNGTVQRIWPRVKVKGHMEEVLDAAKAL